MIARQTAMAQKPMQTGAVDRSFNEVTSAIDARTRIVSDTASAPTRFLP